MTNNPLKAYFRRPAIYFKLPSDGRFYKPGIVNIPPTGQLPVYPMTTMDELAIRNPDGMFNGASTAAVIKNCIPDIHDPWKLNDMDLEAVIIAIRAASDDGKMEVNTKCPSCAEETKFDLDLLAMLSNKKIADYSKSLELGELSIFFKPLTYEESNKNGIAQFEIQRTLVTIESIEDNQEKQKIMAETLEKLNGMMIELIAQTIDHIKTPEAIVAEHEYIKEFLMECDAKTHNVIKEFSVALKKENESKPIDVKCPHCGHEHKQDIVLNFTDFFD